MKKINNTTICCLDTKNKIEALIALDKSIKDISFDKYYFFTDNIDGINISKFENLAKVNLEIFYIPTITSKSDYSKFCLVDLNKYISTNFCLTIQHDGYIINPECWKDEFLGFDYIGAPWPSQWGYKNRVGNGGFCLKSKKFLNLCEEIFSQFDFRLDISRDKYDISINEDFLSCNIYYEEFIANGIKYADAETASYFSIEHPVPEIKEKTFGFHDYFVRR
jgi:hypothetical protein